MIKITKEMLENTSEGDVIASGSFRNAPDEVYLSGDDGAKKVVQWVAVRGEVPDWAIYTESLYDNSVTGHDMIKMVGDKLSLFRVKKIPGLELDEFAEKMYRN